MSAHAEPDSLFSEHFAVDARPAEELLRVVCMGVGMLVPLQSALEGLPLLKRRFESGWVKKSTVDGVMEMAVDVPVTMFSRIYEAVVTGDTSALKTSDLRRFEIPFEEVDDLGDEKFLPAISKIAKKYERNSECKVLSATERRIDQFSWMHSATSHSFGRESLRVFGNLDFVPTSVKSGVSASIRSPTYCRYVLTRGCDFVKNICLLFDLPPIDVGVYGDVIYRNDVVETYIDRVRLLVGDTVHQEISGRLIVALMEGGADVQSLYRNPYKDRPFSEQVALSRRGFRVRLPLFPFLEEDALPTVAIRLQTVDVAVDLRTGDLTYRFNISKTSTSSKTSPEQATVFNIAEQHVEMALEYDASYIYNNDKRREFAETDRVFPVSRTSLHSKSVIARKTDIVSAVLDGAEPAPLVQAAVTSLRLEHVNIESGLHCGTFIECWTDEDPYVIRCNTLKT